MFGENAIARRFMQRILGKDYFVMDQWQLEELAKVRAQGGVKIVSDGLPRGRLRLCFVEPAPSVEPAVADSLAEYGPDGPGRRDSQGAVCAADAGGVSRILIVWSSYEKVA